MNQLATALLRKLPSKERLMSIQAESPGAYLAITLSTACDKSSQCSGDDVLERRVWNFLHCRNIPGMDELAVLADSNTVTLGGSLPSQQVKDHCLECCRHVAGVIRVIDNVTIGKLHQYPE